MVVVGGSSGVSSVQVFFFFSTAGVAKDVPVL